MTINKFTKRTHQTINAIKNLGDDLLGRVGSKTTCHGGFNQVLCCTNLKLALTSSLKNKHLLIALVK